MTAMSLVGSTVELAPAATVANFLATTATHRLHAFLWLAAYTGAGGVN